MATGGMSLSKEFFDFLKAIGESKSKQEEDRICLREMQRLKQKLEPVPPNATHPLSSKKRAKEFLVRILYVEMLGHDASFGYIKAVEMAASASLYHKRTGYLVCGACLPPTHEFRFMLVNQISRDLQAPNVLECSGGVLACTAIITGDMVPAVATEVQKLLTHDSATIRKKSIVCFHHFHQLDDMTVTREQLQDALRKSLCDKEPSVMGASLSVIEALIRTSQGSEIQPFKELVPSLVSILKQIGEHRLPGDYEYHRVPAPWMQLKLIRILGLLGQADHSTSQGMYEVLNTTLKNADAGINAGYAIVYECCFTICKIYPNPTLLDAAADAISRFMQSRSNNVKYLGVTALAQMVEQHPKYAAQHQLAVLDCLEDSDETLQRKTLDLLYRMTNPVNVEFIAAKLIDFITDNNTTDLFLKQVLTTRVCTIAEKYAPNNAWYISTISHLCQVAGEWVDFSVAQNLMSLLAEGTGESEEADTELRQAAIAIYVELLSSAEVATLPSILIETMAWCLGEYAYLSDTTSVVVVLEQLCVLAKNYKTLQSNSSGRMDDGQKRCRHAIVSAILKLVAQAGTCPPLAASTIDEHTCSTDAELAMQCLEFQKMLTQSPHLLPHVFPVDASAEDLDVDVSLSFLDGYVQEALNSGRAQPYQKPEDDDDDEDDYYGGGATSGNQTFNLTPYEKPTKPTVAPILSGAGPAGSGGQQGMSLPPGAAGSGGSTMAATSAPGGAPAGNGLNTRNVANVWGKGGLNTAPQAPAPAAPSPPKTNAWEQVASSSSAHPKQSYGAPVPAAAPPAPAEKTAAQLEKERMAAALFGGIVPGSDVVPTTNKTPSFVPKRTAAPRPAAQVSPPVAAPAPPPAADVDLLDMGAWDSPAPAQPTAAVEHDIFSAPAPAAPAPPVETVSSEEDNGADMLGAGEQAQAPPPAAPAPAAVHDPFAGAGLLESVEDKPLAGFGVSSAKFEYGGTAMTPMQITTAQFGQQWGSCPATANGAVQSSSISTLDAYMQKVQSSVGAHPVEAIAVTSEGICAGSIGTSHACLIHAKLTPVIGAMSINFTVKATDPGVANALATYMQTMLA